MAKPWPLGCCRLTKARNARSLCFTMGAITKAGLLPKFFGSARAEEKGIACAMARNGESYPFCWGALYDPCFVFGWGGELRKGIPLKQDSHFSGFLSEG